MSNPKAPPERVKIELDERSPHALARALDSVDGTVTRVVVEDVAGGHLILAEADKRRHRKCGPCTLCCTLAGVEALKKPPGERCRFQGKGCEIYGNRPGACASFVCAWLIGNFDERYRPDKVGAYVAFFTTKEQGAYAVVQAQSRTLHRKRFRRLVEMLHKALPEVRVIIDDDHGMLLRWGEPVRRIKMLRRPPGDYETAIYAIEG